jgi:hypothetical protein
MSVSLVRLIPCWCWCQSAWQGSYPVGADVSKPGKAHTLLVLMMMTIFNCKLPQTAVLVTLKTRTHSPLALRGVRFQGPRGKWKSTNNWLSLQKQSFCIFSCFSFLCRNIVMGAAPFFLQPLEHQAVRFEDLFELSNNFDAPVSWTVWLMYFIPGATSRICKTAKYEPTKSKGRV